MSGASTARAIEGGSGRGASLDAKAGVLLVVAAHPDDEILGCGATVRKKVLQGWEAHAVLMTRGVAGRQDAAHGPADRAPVATAQAELQEESARAAKVVGFASVTRFDFADNRMDTVSRMDLSDAIRPVVDRLRPDLVLTHHPGDYNWDHTRTFDAVMMAARVNPPEFAPAEIRCFEVPSSTERAWQEPSRAFHPTLFEDVGATIDDKKLAMSYYRSEYRDYPHARSIEALEYLARTRGLQAGIAYAEAFHLVRRIEA